MNEDFDCFLTSFIENHETHHEHSPTVLVWELGGFPLILRKNAILATALNLRGYSTHMVICDGTPIACYQREILNKERFEDWNHRCGLCIRNMKLEIEKYGQIYSVAGDYISLNQKQLLKEVSESENIREIINYKYLGASVGQLAWSSFNRYLKGYSFNVEELSPELGMIYRKYFYAALVNSYVASRVIGELKPISVLTSHGVYVDYGPALALAVRNKIWAISWASGYADFYHYFTIPKSAEKLVIRGMKDELWEKRKAVPLDSLENWRLDAFVRERYIGNMARDIKLSAEPKSKENLKRRLGIHNDRPIICMFPSINWDACNDIATKIFPTANTWMIESIKRMCTLKDVNWIIRIHPGETSTGCVVSSQDVIRQVFEEIPEHIKIIGAGSGINTYGLYHLIDCGITMLGTVGIELSLLGKPVVVAGMPHYSGKGFTFDADSEQKYFSLLEDTQNARLLTDEQRALARQYAYCDFIQRHIPINVINKRQGHWGDVDLDKLHLLLPGNDPVMDMICDRIIDGNDFIMEEDILSQLYPPAVQNN